jgi:hypothetical protein
LQFKQLKKVKFYLALALFNLSSDKSKTNILLAPAALAAMTVNKPIGPAPKDNVSDKEGALVEPMAVAVQAIKEGEVLFGDTVAIC